MFKTNSKFMYIVITLLLCILLVQVLQICTFKPKDFIENFEEEIQSLSKTDLKSLNHKLSLILEKVNCIPNCKKNVQSVSNKGILKKNTTDNKSEKKKGVLFSEDDDIEDIDEVVNEEEYSDDDSVVEGFIDGLSHNCSHV